MPNVPLAKFDDWVRAAIVIAMVGQFVFLVVYAQVERLVIDQGVLTVDVSLVTAAIGYYIGTSSGSNAKSAMLANKGEGQ